MEHIIDAQQITFRYPPELDDQQKPVESPSILKDVSLSIEKGSFTAILGHNGSGKSTFAKHINAILVPESGKMFVAQMDTSDENLLFEIRQKAGMVFQNPDNQIVA
ncbi:MAG: ATP-binding cassette domain-containing protein, partial [Oscillospiraceae bacterium]|nr:ATP-binding cassette domain-containing protein [Oscillospiraceae bacterium]